MRGKQTDLSRETRTPARLHLRPGRATTGQPQQNPCCEWRQSPIRTPWPGKRKSGQQKGRAGQIGGGTARSARANAA
eukprot:7978796-Alexandrium_andersonii.AAC.1